MHYTKYIYIYIYIDTKTNDLTGMNLSCLSYKMQLTSVRVIRNCRHDTILIGSIVVPTQVVKMHAELANLNHCVVLFLSRAAVNLSWCNSNLAAVATNCC